MAEDREGPGNIDAEFNGIVAGIEATKTPEERFETNIRDFQADLAATQKKYADSKNMMLDHFPGSEDREVVDQIGVAHEEYGKAEGSFVFMQALMETGVSKEQFNNVMEKVKEIQNRQEAPESDR